MEQSILNSVRIELLAEAHRSPGLLTDLANLERYIAETYSARSFIELLQNADDAKAKRFLIVQEGDWLLCANDGQAFSRNDFYSLCRSAFSDKKRGQTIGYRGIGFKSVVGMVDEVHLISGALGATFSRELTHESLGINVPTPLVRIPHALVLPSDIRLDERLATIRAAGFSTIFVFGGIDQARVEEEFSLFDSDYLLFLRNIAEVTLSGAKQRRHSCSRVTLQNHCRRVRIASDDRNADWQIHSFDRCDIAFSLVDDKPVPLNSSAALVHAFLPTFEQTGLGVRLNADFSTDPSRTRVVFDDYTNECIASAAGAVAKLFSGAIQANPMDSDIMACMAPTLDLATLAFQKRTLRTELIGRVREQLATLKEHFLIAPPWLNASDAAIAANMTGKSVIQFMAPRAESLLTFLRYLGVRPLSFDAVLAATHSGSFSEQGCSETAAFSIRNAVLGASSKSAAEAPIWASTGGAKSLTALAKDGKALADRFIRQLTTAGVSINDLVRFVRLAVGDAANGLLPDVTTRAASALAGDIKPTVPASNTPAAANSPGGYDPLLVGATRLPSTPYQQPPELEFRFLPAWRGAEQYVVQILQHHGYTVEDRSRQNLGYDLYAEREGRKYYVEVKLLDYAGQPFVITPNEEAVARECGESYALALTLRGKEGVHIQFVHNPVAQLRFVRQCRQWVWECSEYSFSSIVYAKPYA
jgi:hypothetical protein